MGTINVNYKAIQMMNAALKILQAHHDCYGMNIKIAVNHE